MILAALRTAAAAVVVSLWVLIAGPPVLLWTILTGRPAVLYATAAFGVRMGFALAGIVVRIAGAEHARILVVAVDDPAVQHYTEVEQLPPHLMIELERFFRDYKVLEAKTTEVDELYGREAALVVMRRSLDGYRSRAGWKKP